MYDEILLPVDDADATACAIAHAIELAAEGTARLHVLTVADTTRDSVALVDGTVVDALVEAGEEVVAEVAERARDAGVDVVTAVQQGHPADTIVEYARGTDVDVVVMGTAGRSGVERFVLGSVAERVVRGAPVPVLTVRNDE